MTTRQAALSRAVVLATTASPAIVRAAVRAAHGPREDSLRQLRKAQRHCRELLAGLGVAASAVESDQAREDVDA